MSFNQGVSGLSAASSNLDTIGNNIANSQTVGFKSGRSEFADLFAGARGAIQPGLGVQVSGITQSFSGGSLNSTDRNLDMAIDGGGFFRLADGDQTVYSRNGQFSQTNDGRIVNAKGAVLTGYNVSNFNSATAPATVNASGNPVPIQIPSAPLNARATSSASMQSALDSGAVDKSSKTFNADDTSTYNWSAPTTVFDSLGNAHGINLFFSKQGANSNLWRVDSQIASDNGAVKLPAVDLQFDTQGNLTNAYPDSAAAPDPGSSSVTYNTDSSGAPISLGNGSDPLNFTFDFAGSSQTAQKFAANDKQQNGYAPGNLTGITVQKDGTIQGRYSNDQKVDLAQVAVADFGNVQGLAPVGDNAWAQTQSSGQPLLGTPGSGQLGNVLGSTLEASNVDLSKQLVDMIVAQRTYQANAQTIKTQDQVLQTAVNLR